MNMKNGKATGIDRVPADLRNLCKDMNNLLYKIITSYKRGDIPV